MPRQLEAMLRRGGTDASCSPCYSFGCCAFIDGEGGKSGCPFLSLLRRLWVFRWGYSVRRIGSLRCFADRKKESSSCLFLKPLIQHFSLLMHRSRFGIVLIGIPRTCLCLLTGCRR